MLEEQRRPARPHGAVDDLRDLEVGVDLRLHANELALALQERDPLAQVAGRHRDQSTEVAARARAPSATGSRIVVRPRPSSTPPAASSSRSTRLTVAREVPAVCAISSWVSGIVPPNAAPSSS